MPASDSIGGEWRPGRAGVLATALGAVVFVPVVLFSNVLSTVTFTLARSVVLRLVVFGVLVGVLLLRARASSLRLTSDPFFWVFALFTALAAVSGLSGVAPQRSMAGTLVRMWGVVGWATLLVLYLLLRTLFRQEEWWKRLLLASLAVSAIVAVYALLQAAGSRQLQGWLLGVGRGDPVATIGLESFLAAYAFLHVAVGLLLWPSLEGRTLRGGVAAAILLNACTIYLSPTRSLVLGVAVALGGLGLVFLAVGDRRWRKKLAAGLALAVAAGVGLVLLPEGSPIFETFPALGQLTSPFGDPSLKSRFFAWEAGIRGIAEHPLLGVGPENFHVLHNQYFQPEELGLWPEYGLQPVPKTFDRAHNAFLGAAATAGVPAGLAYLGLWGVLGWGLYRGWQSRRLTTWEASVLGTAFTAYGIYLAFWFEDPNSTLVFVMLAAYLGHRVWPRGPRERGDEGLTASASAYGFLTGLRWLLVSAAVLATGTVLFLNGVEVWRAGQALERAGSAGEPWEATEHYRDALAVESSVDRDVALRYGRYLRGLEGWLVLRSRTDSTFVRRAGAELVDAMEAVAEERRREPTALRLHIQEHDLARVAYRTTGEGRYLETAVASMRRALALAPRRLRLHHRLADAHLLAGRTDRALDRIDRALAIYDEFGQTYLVRARIRWAQEERKEAIRDVYRAFAHGYLPWNPSFVREVGGWLEESERLDEAARLYLTYLALRFPDLHVASPTQRALRGGYALPDWKLAYHLPLVQLRAGHGDEALRSARRLLAVLEARNQSPEDRAAVRGFIADVEAGRVERWEEAWSVGRLPAASREGPGAGSGSPAGTGK